MYIIVPQIELHPLFFLRFGQIMVQIMVWEEKGLPRFTASKLILLLVEEFCQPYTMTGSYDIR